MKRALIFIFLASEVKIDLGGQILFLQGVHMIKRDLCSKFGVNILIFCRVMNGKGFNFDYLGLISASEVTIDLGGQI